MSTNTDSYLGVLIEHEIESIAFLLHSIIHNPIHDNVFCILVVTVHQPPYLSYIDSLFIDSLDIGVNQSTLS